MTGAKESAVLRPFRGSATGSAVVLLVSFVTLWFGFWQATATSFAAVACLAYFFAPPILSFYVADPDNWVAHAVFELTALIGNQLSTRTVACRRIVAKSHEIDCNAGSRSASDRPVMGNAPPQDKAPTFCPCGRDNEALKAFGVEGRAPGNNWTTGVS